ncbi:hypothetical protein Tco_0956839 [Tanacetum coccineum]
MVELEPVKKMSKKELLKLDEELAFKLQAKEEEEKRLAREKAQQVKEANIAWDDTAGEELEQESSKKQKLEEDKEFEELKQYLEIVLDDGDDVTIDATPLSTKSLTIMFKNFDKEDLEVLWSIVNKEDLETLWKLVKAKHGSTRPEEGYERVLWGDLKTMFDPHVEDQVWRNQQDYRVLDWKIYDSCGVHSLRMQHMHIHMLVEKRYPLTPATITDMLNKKLQCDHFSEMGRIVGIKRLHDDLEVTAAKLKLVLFINSNEKYAK